MKPRLALDNCHISIQSEEWNYIMRLQRPALEAVQSHSPNDKIRNAWDFISILHIHNITVELAVRVDEGVNLGSFLKKSHVSEKHFHLITPHHELQLLILSLYFHCLFSRLLLSSLLPYHLSCSFLFLIICVCLSISHRILIIYFNYSGITL